MQAQRKPLQVSKRIRPIPRTHLEGGGKARLHSGSSRPDGDSHFKSGDPVRETGIYEVLHDSEHRSVHEVVMLNGDTFPPCDTCDHRVRFRLVRTAPYIFQDEDFAE